MVDQKIFAKITPLVSIILLLLFFAECRVNAFCTLNGTETSAENSKERVEYTITVQVSISEKRELQHQDRNVFSGDHLYNSLKLISSTIRTAFSNQFISTFPAYTYTTVLRI